MYGLLLALLLLDGLFLSVIVLLQAGKGGGLAAMGGGAATDSLMGGRQAATLLTKASWVSGGLFLFLALVLSVMSTRRETLEPLLRGEFEGPAAPAPVVPGTQPAQEGEAVPIPGTQPAPDPPPPDQDQP